MKDNTTLGLILIVVKKIISATNKFKLYAYSQSGYAHNTECVYFM